MADLVLRKISHVVVFSDDSDFISLYVAIRDETAVPAAEAWGAAQPSSLLSRIRARAVTRAELFPTRIRCCSSSRCSVASRTAYLSRTITATPTVNTSSPAVYGYRPDSRRTFNFKID